MESPKEDKSKKAGQRRWKKDEMEDEGTGIDAAVMT